MTWERKRTLLGLDVEVLQRLATSKGYAKSYVVELDPEDLAEAIVRAEEVEEREAKMSRRWFCERPEHPGDRGDVHPSKRLEKRIEYRRMEDGGRDRVVKIGNICRPCMEDELATDRTEAMF